MIKTHFTATFVLFVGAPACQSCIVTVVPSASHALNHLSPINLHHTVLSNKTGGKKWPEEFYHSAVEG